MKILLKNIKIKEKPGSRAYNSLLYLGNQHQQSEIQEKEKEISKQDSEIPNSCV